MRHFCTYFDSAYVWKGLALYESLRNVASDFCLHIMALDEKSYEFLSALSCESLTVDNLKDIETEQLLKLKQERTRAEYCWTCGPEIILHIIEKYGLSDVTYLDSDLMFFSTYDVIYDEIGDASVAITPQYAKNSNLTGKYCVQFMFFKNDEQGMACLKWWRDRCLEWCYARYEDGKFGDQKYLDDFPRLFEKVAIVHQRGVGVAEWNMELYEYHDGMVEYEGVSAPLVFYHYHGMRVSAENGVMTLQLFDCPYSKRFDELFFQPYMQLIAKNLKKYFGQEVHIFRVKKKSLWSRILTRVKAVFRNIGIVQKIYFKVHKHKGWEESKL